jgi:hypothetical protein
MDIQAAGGAKQRKDMANPESSVEVVELSVMKSTGARLS